MVSDSSCSLLDSRTPRLRRDGHPAARRLAIGDRHGPGTGQPMTARMSSSRISRTFLSPSILNSSPA